MCELNVPRPLLQVQLGLLVLPWSDWRIWCHWGEWGSRIDTCRVVRGDEHLFQSWSVLRKGTADYVVQVLHLITVLCFGRSFLGIAVLEYVALHFRHM